MHETVFVLGLGETLKFFYDYDKPKIGVNDIYRKVKTEVVVCVDNPGKFIPDRLDVIKNSTPKIFFSHLPKLEQLVKSFHWNAPLISVNHRVTIFKDNTIYSSNNSTFVACSLAHVMGFRNIVIYGADFNTHSKLKGEYAINKIVNDFAWLHQNLESKGVNLMVGHRASRLSDVLPIHQTA